MTTLDAATIKERLGLRPHPEGGWYAETFRDTEGGPRGHSTAIYFLLEAGDVSIWHRVRDASEVWLWHAGAPLALSMAHEGQPVRKHVLGMDLGAGEHPQVIVPAGWWQTAHSLGEWTLVSCTVAPGFVFDQFEMADPDWEPDWA